MSKLSSWKLGLIERPSLHLTPAPPQKKKSIPKCMYSKCTKYNICDMICIYIYIYVLRMHNLYIYMSTTLLNIMYVMIYIYINPRKPHHQNPPFAAWRICRRTGFSFLCLRLVSIHKGMCLIEAARTHAQVAQASKRVKLWQPATDNRRNGEMETDWPKRGWLFFLSEITGI